MDNKILTKEGLNKLKEELEHLKNNKRPQVSDRIKQAKELGDLSENAEYQEAKEEQSFVEGRILELERLIKTSSVAEKASSDGRVHVGSQVKIDKEGQIMNFTIVGSTEADPVRGKISLESPFGEALMGKSVGDEAEINLPGRKTTCKILEIQ
ncbi:MAG: transcription elongation factor GreA [Candidatus Komeilibacteria bacterium RIFOXYC1_FULL_37_11]|uniref:Transcription elongation factor GreA n=1 Tax=Candidatus Komeilibacteria bacterium RIFOXYC1_FULL_37_11 TaxID=1798555 RepID=A0A1G2C0Z0_9BACT|nr:MAG: transcription elongation factor GreA [Candidatus Komeilibacteria bacterium RIFOXYC1_FULL_37_11]OGY95554.1 MAG: transcription elongation factor GreA [Candidatus Komeilibacteria bacterium RIFOXYD1_FULL_37_29]OGY96289.1 MAG: transcription elongation factor GreA [Candidatus Komeilibacteria bacterium RIFOXYD2_FULL_37_8]